MIYLISIFIGVKRVLQEYYTIIKNPVNPIYHQAHQDLNLYRNVLCLESSRVVLKHNLPPDMDYINANWVVYIL